MPTTISCPSCNRQLNVPEELLGKNVQCPACSLTFRVSSGGEAELSPRTPQNEALDEEPENLPRRPRAEHWEDDELDEDDDYDVLPRRRRRGESWRYNDGDREGKRVLILPPAICLLVTAVLGLMVDIFQVGFVFVNQAQPGQPAPHVQVKDDDFWGGFQAGMEKGSHGPQAIVLGALFAGLNVVIILCSIQMMRQKMWGLALAGSILSMGNCVNLCCCLGLPFGIWAVIILAREDVRAVFD